MKKEWVKSVVLVVLGALIYMAGASISIMKLDEESKQWLDMPVNTPFYCQK